MGAVKPDIDRKAQQEHLAAVCERGIQACRDGNWQAGLVDLAWLVKGKQARQLPSQCYSYLGYGIALTQDDVVKGRRLCRRAVKMEWFQPDNYFNLARTCLLREHYRQDAVDAVDEGLKVDPEHEGLLELSRKIGRRRPPVLGFLSRGNILNRLFGSLRHVFSKPPEPLADLEPSAESESGSVVVS